MKDIKISRLYEISTMVKELEAEATKIKDEVKDEYGVGVHVFGDLKVSVTESTRESLNKKGLRDLLGDKLKEFISETTYKSVSVRRD